MHVDLTDLTSLPCVIVSTLWPLSTLDPPQATASLYLQANQGQEEARTCPGPVSWILDSWAQESAGGCSEHRTQKPQDQHPCQAHHLAQVNLRLSWAPGTSCRSGGQPPTWQLLSGTVRSSCIFSLCYPRYKKSLGFPATPWPPSYLL